MNSVALWEPDIVPPDDWLVPSVLYQDRISTFAPSPPYVDDHDGREAQRMVEELGPLYMPLSLGNALHPPDAEALLHLLRSDLTRWQHRMARFAERTHDPLVTSWLNRTMGWSDRRQRMNTSHREAVADWVDIQQRVAAATERVQQREAQSELARAQLAAALETLGPALTQEKAERTAAYAETLERRAQLLRPRRRRWGDDPDRDVAIRALNAEVQQIEQRLAARPPSATRAEYDQVVAAVLDADRALQGAKRDLQTAQSQLADAGRKLNRTRNSLSSPWESDRLFDRWLEPDQLRWKIPPLETIAAGKVYGKIFEFLATEAGMWVSQRSDAPYAGTLVAPKPVVEDVLATLAEWHCYHTPGWVTMSSATRPDADDIHDPRSQDELVSLAIRWTLPIPRRASLTQARDFRLRHEDELRVVRSALAADLPDPGNVDDIADAIAAMRLTIAEPLAEIERALGLDRALGIRQIGETVLHRLLSDGRTLLGGLAAAGIAAPVLGNTLTVEGLAAGVGGGLALSAAGLSALHVRNLVLAWRLGRHIERGPYKYLYDIGRQLGST